MNDDNMNDLKEVLFNMELEGYYYYQDEENKDDYFIAYQLIVIASNQDDEDCEFELLDYIKTSLSDDNLIFTDVGVNSETHRIVGLPEIEYFEFENGNYTLLEDINIVEAIDFLRNIKTIKFKDLKSNNVYDKKNYKHSIFEIDYNLSKIENEKKIKNNKKKITALLFEAIIYKISNPELALNKIDKAIGLEIIDNTENAYSYFIRAEIFIKLNNNEKAIEDLEKILKLEPGFEKAIQLLESLK